MCVRQSESWSQVVQSEGVRHRRLLGALRVLVMEIAATGTIETTVAWDQPPQTHCPCRERVVLRETGCVHLDPGGTLNTVRLGTF